MPLCQILALRTTVNILYDTIVTLWKQILKYIKINSYNEGEEARFEKEKLFPTRKEQAKNAVYVRISTFDVEDVSQPQQQQQQDKPGSSALLFC